MIPRSKLKSSEKLSSPITVHQRTVFSRFSRENQLFVHLNTYKSDYHRPFYQCRVEKFPNFNRHYVQPTSNPFLNASIRFSFSRNPNPKSFNFLVKKKKCGAKLSLRILRISHAEAVSTRVSKTFYQPYTYFGVR